jgi:RNA polymerase sigma-70 factor (ECF subfamily)
MRVLEAGVMGGSHPGSSSDAGPAQRLRDDQRITSIVREHHAFVWRLLLRLGVPASGAEDAVQQVFLVAMRRVAEIAPGSEKSFLFGTALRVASDERRHAKHREVPNELPESAHSGADPEQQLEARRQRGVLQEVLLEMPLELRTVFVLFELEQMTKTEVAELLGLPVGTAVSRLRRARELFRQILQQRGFASSGKP